MVNTDLSTLLNANSIIIDGSSKAGKMTFLFYLINFFYKDKAIIFTPQESYLFYRRVDALSSQYLQFKKLKESVTTYFLDEEWNSLKQKYGYDFFLKELVQIIETSQENVIVMHRVGEFFEFQDRYEIENIYKTLIKIAIQNDKKMIFLANNQNENFEYIHNIAEEFTDVSISIKSNENNERILNIQDVLKNKEYPLMHFRINKENFILDLYEKNQVIPENITKNVLIAELNQMHDNIREICSYIFEKPNFNIKYADSLQTILQEVFIAPDMIIVLMERNQKNFDTITAIKEQLPDSKIIGIVDQDFVRTEDIQEAYKNGCDELFANNFTLETFILSLQKASNSLFYTNSMDSLTHYKNIMNSEKDFISLAEECREKSLFFTAFTLESKESFEFQKASSRNNDYIYQTEHKIYYLALSTMPKDIKHIIDKYRKKYSDIELTCIWEPINHESIEHCVS